jgi:prepilin-type N-terminal cleavage/methylation domain-containing protein
VKVFRPFEIACRLSNNPIRRGRLQALQSAIGNRQSAIAFTLVELLVVISIMGLIAALAVPAIKNLGKSNVQASASRQLLDEIGRARQLAISQHRTVYMVFVPTNFFNLVDQNNNTVLSDANNSANFAQPSYQAQALNTLSNLVSSQLGGYNFVSLGQVGDQPGQHSWHYLSTWQSLPNGTFIAAAKFLPQNSGSPIQIPIWQQQDYPGQIDNWLYLPPLQSQIYGFAQFQVPFPTDQWNPASPTPLFNMPCLVFDSTGRMISETPDNISFHHAYIPLAQGTIGYGVDVNKNPTFTAVGPNAISETPPGNSTSISYNIIDVDPLSGRARLLVHQIQ